MRLSVAVCTYNGEKYIKEQLLSIIRQDYPIDEIVVCDDGSNDNTLNIVRRIANKFNKLDWHIEKNSPNIGVTRNFEKAISFCTGDIIFLSDQDDIWLSNKVKVIVDFFRNHPNINVVFTDAYLVDSEGNKLTKYSLLDAVDLKPNLKYWNKGINFEIMNHSNKATGATMAFRRDYVNILMPFHKIGLHDEQIATIASLQSCIEVIPLRLISYRQHGNNVVGISKGKWIYTGETCPDLLKTISKPTFVKDICWRYKTPTIYFHNLRFKSANTIYRYFLTLLIPLYICFYKKFWFVFFISDLKKE